ncbi:MAG: prepilin-type N-terminal cleavage/methylation domain-containing protein [Bacilli bacterium]
MKKKSGFTLIELLAVIVILAIIALIATPMVLKYIESSKKGSFESSVDTIERAVDLKIVDMEKSNQLKYPVEIDVQDLDIKNKKGLIGTVTVSKDDKNNNVYTYDLTNGEYNLIGTKDNKAYKVDKSVKLKFKTDNGIVDKNNNYVYSFYTDTVDLLEGYGSIELSDFIDVENGSIEFIQNEYSTYSTGAKIILKDKDGKVAQKYTVIIFGDINGDGWTDGSDLSDLDWYLYYGNRDYFLKSYALFAADVNRDGQITKDDYQIIEDTSVYICLYNNITYECLPFE